MARRHEKFSYTYGWRTAPESYQFYLNGKLINLGCNTRNKLGYMCACGDIKKAEKELKRLLRKEEKRSSICGKCIAFYVLNGQKYVYSQAFLYNPHNRNEALLTYKQMKHYIEEHDNKISSSVRTTSGFVTPYGAAKCDEVTEEYDIDLSRGCVITVTQNPKNVMFPVLLKSYRKEKEGKI